MPYLQAAAALIQAAHPATAAAAATVAAAAVVAAATAAVAHLIMAPATMAAMLVTAMAAVIQCERLSYINDFAAHNPKHIVLLCRFIGLDGRSALLCRTS